MAFQRTLKVANASPYPRHDFVEVDDMQAPALGVPSQLDDSNLRLLRKWPGGSEEEVAYQIDYPFGKQIEYRTLTFFSRDTAPGDPHYQTHSAEFSLEEGTPRDFSGTVNPGLKIEHFSQPGKFHRTWDPGEPVSGVELSNGIAPWEPGYANKWGLRVYFSLLPRPEVTSEVNYAGAATSVVHYRSERAGAGDVLAPYDHDPWRKHAPQKRWGQLTALDFYPLPWERRYYYTLPLLGTGGREPEYTLVWSNAGPLRATVTLKSEDFAVPFGGEPFFQPKQKEILCNLYRIISLYPEKEFYTEQLIVRPKQAGLDPSHRMSLAFRAHYYSYLDYPHEFDVWLARSEKIPDYFAVWRKFGASAGPYRGYAFASDSHVRQLEVWPDWPNIPREEIRWRLQLGHEHRCVHLFPLLLAADPASKFEPFHDIGHTGWYERLFKPLQVIPLDRYVSP